MCYRLLETLVEPSVSQPFSAAIMPSAGRPAPAIQPNKDGSVTIQYVPTQSGVHELNLSYNEAPVEGNISFVFHSDPAG
jgi:hypothetical protein